MEHQMECGQAAHHQLQLEQQEAIIGFRCPFCDNVYSTDASDCDGTDIVCCGEVGECVPYTRDDKIADEIRADRKEEQLRDEYEADMAERDAEYDARNWADEPRQFPMPRNWNRR